MCTEKKNVIPEEVKANLDEYLELFIYSGPCLAITPHGHCQVYASVGEFMEDLKFDLKHCESDFELLSCCSYGIDGNTHFQILCKKGGERNDVQVITRHFTEYQKEEFAKSVKNAFEFGYKYAI